MNLLELSQFRKHKKTFDNIDINNPGYVKYKNDIINLLETLNGILYIMLEKEEKLSREKTLKS